MTALVLAGGGLRAEGESLSVRIDQMLKEGTVLPMAGPVEDAALVRRLYVDLVGRIPSTEELESYLSDGQPDKRVRLIDQLLGTPEFDRHMALVLDLWLMERRKDAHVPSTDWRKFLTDSFTARKPLNELMREVLLADGTPEKNRAAARFYLDRVFEPHLVTRDTGRLFFGRDLQCAQCHDHPNVDDYLQSDYYGLFAYFSRSSLFHPDTKKPSLLTEKASGDPNFLSVFTGVKGESRPQLPGGEKLLQEPVLEAGKEYKVAPNPKDKNVRAIPTYSRREQLALQATDGSNAAFNRNMANRLWAHVMGRGLVEPLDMHHADNLASHPALLDLLVEQLVASKFDVRAFLKELALTEVYARTFEMPRSFSNMPIGDLEQRAAKASQAAEESRKAYKDARDSWEKAMKEHAIVTDALVAARKTEVTTMAARKKVEEPLQKEQATLKAIEAKHQPLMKATAAAEEAGRALPDDQELAGAIAVLKKRRDVLTQEREKQSKVVAAKKATAQGAIKKHEDALLELKRRDEESQGTEVRVASMEKVRAEARARFRDLQEEELLAKRQLEDAQLLTALASHRDEEAELKKQVAQLGGEQAELERSAEASRQNAQVLEEAVREAEAAEKAIGDDQELTKAIGVLRNRREGAQVAVKDAEDELKRHRDKLGQAQERWDSLLAKQNHQAKALQARSSSMFAVGVFAQMSPEVLFQSMLHATGEWEIVQNRIVAEFERKLLESQKPAPAKEEKKDPKKKPEPKLTEADRARYLAEQTEVKLKTGYTRFVRLFGGQAGQPQTEFYATADQALFLENDGGIRSWIRPNGNNLCGRLSKLTTSEEIADQLYLSILSRRPQPEEKNKMVSFLSEAESPKEKIAVIQDLAWALLTSVEFRFRH